MRRASTRTFERALSRATNAAIEASLAEIECALRAWLIEETWSGHVHYVHRDFDHKAWRAECASLDRLPYEWVSSGGGATLTRRKASIPFITKDVDQARRFASKAEAYDWLADQRLDGSDQFQPREHMWPDPSATASPSERPARPRETPEKPTQERHTGSEPSGGWQPIETAPHGRSVLIWRPSHIGDDNVFVASLSDGRWECEDGKDYYGLRGEYPSHWMPLPSPPALGGPA